MTVAAQPNIGLGAFRPTNYNLDTGTAYPLGIDADLAIIGREADLYVPCGQDTPTMKVVVGPGYIFQGTAVTVGGTGVVMNGNRDFTGNVAAGSTVITVVSRIDGLTVGYLIQGSGIPLNTTIVALGGTGQGSYTITLSGSATASSTGAALRCSQLTAAIVAPAANPRNDIVYIDANSGIVGVATGAEANPPSDPALPLGKLPVGRIKLTGSSVTAITNSMMDDIRALHTRGIPQAVLNQVWVFAVDSSLSPNTITATVSPLPQALKKGARVSVLIANTVTGATVLNVGVGGNIAVNKMSSTGLVALASSDLRVGQMADFEYDGTVWQAMSVSSGSSGSSAADYSHAAILQGVH